MYDSRLQPGWIPASSGTDGELLLMPPRKVVKDDEMDITPMIDVTFLLLIYFLLVSTPDLQTSVELAPARHGNAVSRRIATVITIDESGSELAPVYLADGTVAGAQVQGSRSEQREQIAEHIRRGLQDEAKANVVIKADRRVPHREVARVMRAASDVEGIQLHLAVLESDQD